MSAKTPTDAFFLSEVTLQLAMEKPVCDLDGTEEAGISKAEEEGKEHD